MSIQENLGVFKRPSWHHRRDARFVIFVAVVLVLYHGQGRIYGPGRISDQVNEMIHNGAERVDLVVTTKFPAEEFHMGVFQRVGGIRGVAGNETLLFGVKPKDIRSISRKYWVENIDLAPADE